MKQTPTFLIAHSRESKEQSTFIVCTKGPKFLARVVEFATEEHLNNYITSLLKPFRKLSNRLIIIELHEFFCDEKQQNKANRMLDRMVTWYSSYGETRA